jgi:hypothetical protein
MTFGLYDHERRRRRRAWTRTFKFLLVLGILTALGLFAYQMGVEQVKGRETGLREENAQLVRVNAELGRAVAKLQTAGQQSDARIIELEGRLSREVPAGDLAKLTQSVREKLAAGIEPSRIAFVLSQMRSVRSCEKPESKRFILATPIFKGANTSVGFVGGAVTVSGEGVSARSGAGNAEGWFDPAAPVTIRFADNAGHQSEAQGTLPLQHITIFGGTEHRFHITAGARSFVEVTAERCPFP